MVVSEVAADYLSEASAWLVFCVCFLLVGLVALLLGEYIQAVAPFRKYKKRKQKRQNTEDAETETARPAACDFVYVRILPSSLEVNAR